MAKLIAMKDSGSTSPSATTRCRPPRHRHAGHGLMNPNHYLSVAIDYLFAHRPGWPVTAQVGKTLVTSSMIDRVCRPADAGCAGSAGRFQVVRGRPAGRDLRLRRRGERGRLLPAPDGGVWTTDKDGIMLNLLAAEITAVTGKDPGDLYKGLEAKHGSPVYERMDAPATRPRRSCSRRSRRTGDLGGAGRASPSWPRSPTRRATARPSAA
jgi:phosphoglucomutase